MMMAKVDGVILEFIDFTPSQPFPAPGAAG